MDVNIVSNDVLDLEAFKAWRPEYETAEFILEDGKYICGWAVEKMSKSMFNVVNPLSLIHIFPRPVMHLQQHLQKRLLLKKPIHRQNSAVP